MPATELPDHGDFRDEALCFNDFLPTYPRLGRGGEKPTLKSRC